MPLGLLARDSIGDLTEFINNRDDIAALSSLSTTTSHEDTDVFHDTTTVNNSKTANSRRKNYTSLESQQKQQQQQQQQQKEANPQQPPSLFQFVDYYNDSYYTNYMNDHIDNDQQDDYINHTPGTASLHSQYNTNNSTSNFLQLPGHSRSNNNDNNNNRHRNHFLCCLFPWLQPQQQQPSTTTKLLLPQQQQQQDHDIGAATTTAATNVTTTTTIPDSDEASNNSNLLGERLSDRERQAVLARLRLVQPETNHNNNTNTNTTYEQQQVHTTTTNANNETSSIDHMNNAGTTKQRSSKGLLNGIPVYDTSPLDDSIGGGGSSSSNCSSVKQIKGILKNRSLSKVIPDDSESVMSDKNLQQNLPLLNLNGSISSSSNKVTAATPLNVSNSSNTSVTAVRRRSLFPSYEEKKPRMNNNHVTFSPMARVVTVKSKNDMTFDEKSDVWWQKSDYEDFRKTGRIITKAMLEGGGEIWLTGGSSTTSSNNRNDPASLASSTKDATNANDKWWHKFGHSRRGLEHVVSIEEGRQRQMNVKNAIRAVLDEQTRQKMYKRVDPEKLRHVALQHTMWARDLALASGASDADAVDQSFSEGRRSREFFLLKMSRNKTQQPLSGSVKVEPKNIPQFMQPSHHTTLNRPLSARMTGIPANQLDAHTASQIQFRRQKMHASSDPTITVSPQQQQQQQVSQSNRNEGLCNETQEELHDPADSKNTTTIKSSTGITSTTTSTTTTTPTVSMAQKAAGFVADDREKVNISAVLSGMGGTVMISNTNSKKNETTTLPTIMRVAS